MCPDLTVAARRVEAVEIFVGIEAMVKLFRTFYDLCIFATDLATTQISYTINAVCGRETGGGSKIGTETTGIEGSFVMCSFGRSRL